MPFILTLSRYYDLFTRLAASVKEFESKQPAIVVQDESDPLERRAPMYIEGWTTTPGVQPFVFARNANIGLRMCHQMHSSDQHGVLFLNDDCILTKTVTLPVSYFLEHFCRQHPEVGLVAPLIDGETGLVVQQYKKGIQGGSSFEYTVHRIPFIAVYIPFSTMDNVGFLDESYTGYGGEDVNYCMRVQKAGLKLAVYRACPPVQHPSASTSFLRQMSKEAFQESARLMYLKFKSDEDVRNA
jgi:GT2 family glycosyltransferase